MTAPAPQWAEPLEMLPVPEDAPGPLFIRRENTITRLTSTGHFTYLNRTVRILQPQALQLGNLALVWNPAAGEAVIHGVRIRRGERIIDVLEKTRFEILRREDQLEAAMLDGLLTATLSIPDLRVGDDLEVEYTLPTHDPTMGTTSHGLLHLAEAPPGGRFRLELSWEDGEAPKTRLTPDFAEIAQRDSNRVVVSFDNPEALPLPAKAPARFLWARMIEFSDFENWAAVSRRFHGLFAAASAVAPASPLKTEAANIAAAHSGKLDRAKAALQLVQQQVRYVYVGLDGGNFTPASAEETWDRRYGDCKGKTAMLLALLGELSIPAEAVLVNNTLSSDGFDTKLASPGLFDHVLVRARIDGKTWWLDATLPDIISARSEPFLPFTWVLPLTAKGAELERQTERPFDLPQEMELYEIDASDGFDEPARWTQTIVARGAAGLQQHLRFTSVASNQLETTIRSQFTGSGRWDSVESVKYRYDRDTEASILTIHGIAPVVWEKVSDGGYRYHLPGGGFSPPERRQRGTDSKDKDVPFYQPFGYSCYVTTMRLPDNTDLVNWRFNSTFDTMLFGRAFYRLMELRKDRTLRLVRGSRVEESEISAQKALRDNQRLRDFDNSMATLVYHPGASSEPTIPPRPIPAISELDWTGRGAPCMPPDMLKTAK
jgi:hypothetical protein